jgi:hypothetical protein
VFGFFELGRLFQKQLFDVARKQCLAFHFLPLVESPETPHQNKLTSRALWQQQFSGKQREWNGL